MEDELATLGVDEVTLADVDLGQNGAQEEE